MSHSYTDTILNETLAPSDTRAVEVQVDQYNLLEIDNIEEFNGYLRQDRRNLQRKSSDADAASKSALQMQDILLKNGHLRDGAPSNSLKDFRFACFDAVQDALIAGYEQGRDFLLCCWTTMKRTGNSCRYSLRMCIEI